jgi:alpha-L-fucosidase 2
MKIWYNRPAEKWEQALPVGNGRLGAMISGCVKMETVYLDEESLWSGHPTDNNRHGASKHIKTVRELIFSGQYEKAKQLAEEKLTGGYKNFGTHLRAGTMEFVFLHKDVQQSSYHRELDLSEAVSKVSYKADGVNYERTAFASYPDKVMVLTFSADRPSSVNMNIELQSDRDSPEYSTDTNGLKLRAKCPAGGVSFEIYAHVVTDGGSKVVENNKLKIRNSDQVKVLLDVNSSFRGENYQNLNAENIRSAADKIQDSLLENHKKDFRSLFNRVSLDLNGKDFNTIPTDQRLLNFQNGNNDNDLISIFFQYGRYLLISSSRPASLAANLQGIWNDNKASMMAWTCDYHLDINTQMNYWPAEVCNLSECHEPAFELIESLVEPGRKTARIHYGCRGWVAHVFTNIWGFTCPGYQERWGFHVTGGLWMALHMADHYRFTLERKFLAERAYPVLKESAEFFLEFLTEHPVTGRLVTCPSCSPENIFETNDAQRASVCAGPTCDNILIRELFSFCIDASKELNKDTEFRAILEEALNKLPSFQIGKDGSLQEWLEDFKEPEPEHRHTSHLLGLFPFSHITPDKTPELADAAAKVLSNKMSLDNWEDTEWCRAWNICFYARLRDAQRSLENIKGLLNISFPNLLTYSPPHGGSGENIYVLDGNTGAAAGIAEMLLQSNDQSVLLLPALPKEWHTGSVKGLRARGGYEIDIVWDKNKLSGVRIISLSGNTCRIIYEKREFFFDTVKGYEYLLDSDLNHVDSD